MTNSELITLRILLFAGVRSAIGLDHLDLTVPAGTTLAAVREELARSYPSLAPLVVRSRFAVDSEFAGDGTAFATPAQLAWIPPVSGG